MLTSDLSLPQISVLLERGCIFNSTGEVEMAVSLFTQACELGLQSGEIADFYTIDAAHMLGIVMPANDEQLKWNLLALGLTEQTAAPRAQNWRGSLLNNIDWTYHDRGDYQQALTIFEQAYAWYEENAKDKPERIRIARWCVARTCRSLERYEEALVLQEDLAAEYERLNEPPDGFVFEEIGECLLVLRRPAEARLYFFHAYELLSQMDWLAEDRLARLKKLAEDRD